MCSDNRLWIPCSVLVTLNRILYKQDCDVLIHTDCDDLSHVMRKQDFCLCENIGADQLCSIIHGIIHGFLPM